LAKIQRRSRNPEKVRETSDAEQVPITVGIGASAGGLEAFKLLLERLPVDTGLSFVIFQHLATAQESMLTDILSRFTKMPVQTVVNGMPVERNHVYVIPPGTIITMENKSSQANPKRQSQTNRYLSNLSI